MINANELRMWNLVKDGDFIFQVSISTFSGNEINGRDSVFDYDPIPLTEEWLLKFGFDLYDYGDIKFIRNPDLRLNGFEFFYKNIPITQVEYVHQLQNLYFALTGTELEIK